MASYQQTPQAQQQAQPYQQVPLPSQQAAHQQVPLPSQQPAYQQVPLPPYPSQAFHRSPQEAQQFSVDGQLPSSAKSPAKSHETRERLIWAAQLLGTLLLAGATLWGIVEYADYLITHGDTSAITSDATFQPDVQIAFVRYEDPKEGRTYIDEVLLDIKNGSGVSWKILDSAGIVVAHGLGERVVGVFHDLPNGSYTIEWIVQNELGAENIVNQNFSVDWAQ
ncbi:MAG: hypothetical protein LBI64_01500 [Coriobacteriales bacterium]|jgi:hypothetical protein|nr:hypothetical protein [Coriobacteriales bacterium]